MLEVLRYIAYIALKACVKYYTKDQSNVKGVEGTLYRFQCIKCYVMVCMLKISKMVLKCVCVLFPSLTSSTYIALQPLGVFDLSSTSLTCFNIHSI